MHQIERIGERCEFGAPMVQGKRCFVTRLDEQHLLQEKAKVETENDFEALSVLRGLHLHKRTRDMTARSQLQHHNQDWQQDEREPKHPFVKTLGSHHIRQRS